VEGGVYVVVFRLGGWYRGPLGRRLWVELPPGVYAYVGSAWGPGGLGARLRRHLCGSRRRLWWHIDYLASSGVYEPVGAGVCRGAPRGWEPVLASLLYSSRLFVELGPGVGGSDDPLGFGHVFLCAAERSPGCVGAVLAALSGLPCLPGWLWAGEACGPRS
jgi:Uri superfamily endonuclease